ncbi:MAG TPA: cyclic nucleotide-binding domain-containing protein [Burkholderiaceae bacterium]|nr:cyclic nucleotide-binding domain-containing protein [Burkholderiaceae bacterium]
MGFSDWIAQTAATAQTHMSTYLSSPAHIVAAIAVTLGVVLIVAGAFVRTMLPLRWLAAGSDLSMLVFGALAPNITTLLVASALLPINVFRAVEVTRLTRRVHRAQADADLSGLWLRPYMKPRRLVPGEVLFRKGDIARHLYFLVDGELQLSDIGKPLETGRIFGEIALFSPSRKRTHTATAMSPCHVLEMHENTVMELYFQNPAFGFHLIELLVGRLTADVERSETRPVEA